jgi:hypothetical protein
MVKVFDRELPSPGSAPVRPPPPCRMKCRLRLTMMVCLSAFSLAGPAMEGSSSPRVESVDGVGWCRITTARASTTPHKIRWSVLRGMPCVENTHTHTHTHHHIYTPKEQSKVLYHVIRYMHVENIRNGLRYVGTQRAQLIRPL